MSTLTLTVCYDDCLVRTLSHGAVSGGPFELHRSVLGDSSGAIGEIIGVEASGILVLVQSGEFSNGENITQTDGPNTGATATLDADPTRNTSSVTLHDDQRIYSTGRGLVKGADLQVSDTVKLFTDQNMFRIVSIP